MALNTNLNLKKLIAHWCANNIFEINTLFLALIYLTITPVGTRGLKSRMCPPYPNACRKRRLKLGAVI